MKVIWGKYIWYENMIWKYEKSLGTVGMDLQLAFVIHDYC